MLPGGGHCFGRRALVVVGDEAQPEAFAVDRELRRERATQGKALEPAARDCHGIERLNALGELERRLAFESLASAHLEPESLFELATEQDLRLGIAQCDRATQVGQPACVDAGTR